MGRKVAKRRGGSKDLSAPPFPIVIVILLVILPPTWCSGDYDYEHDDDYEASGVAAVPTPAIFGRVRRYILGFIIGLACTTVALAAKTSWNNPPKRGDATVQNGTFRSAALKTDVGYNICLPPEYSEKQSQRFPVIYYLHGYEGNESSFLEYAKYWREAVKKFGPVILVFVNGGETSFFCDSPDGALPGETLVVRELIPHIDQKFRTATNAAARSLHGYSMGGFGALKLSFKYPQMFGSVVAYGATLSEAAEFKKRLGKVFAQMFGNDPKRFAGNDPFVLAERNADQIRSRLAIKIVVGTKDDFLARNRALHQKLEQLKIPHSYEEARGAEHKKDDLYQAHALGGFQFSVQHAVPNGGQ
jgi:S-formylglutathione hydrolase FrmB